MTSLSAGIQGGSQPEDLRALVAIDLGAESCRVSLLRWIEGAPVISLVHRFLNAPRQTAGGLHWDLAGIEAGINEGLRACAPLAPEGIRALAVDGWAVDYVRLAPHGAAVADPFCYRDERTIASEEALHQQISKARLREITGIELLRINTLYQVAADTSELKRLPFLNLPEYILSRLGGRAVAERTNASHTEMLDLATGTWSSEILAAAGVGIDAAPPVVAPGTLVGEVGGELAKLPAFAGAVLIAPACHDTASAIAGIPATGEDWAYISSGTWSLVGATLPEPNNGPAARADNFTNLGAAGGRILFHKNVNGMWLIRQCLEHWAAQAHVWAIPDLVAAAERVPPPGGLLEVDDPDLLLPGDMPRRINAQRVSRGLEPLDESASNAPSFASLIFHSLAARYAAVLAHIAAQTGKQFKRLFIVGGASQNLFLNRLTAAATGLPVIRGSQESSTLGNFAVQLAALEHPESASGASAEAVSRWAAILQTAPIV